MIIKNQDDLRKAYWLVRFDERCLRDGCYRKGNEHKVKKMIVEQKRAIRAFLKEP